MFEEIVTEVKRWCEIIGKTAEHILETQPGAESDKKQN